MAKLYRRDTVSAAHPFARSIRSWRASIYGAYVQYIFAYIRMRTHICKHVCVHTYHWHWETTITKYE